MTPQVQDDDRCASIPQHPMERRFGERGAATSFTSRRQPSSSSLSSDTLSTNVPERQSSAIGLKKKTNNKSEKNSVTVIARHQIIRGKEALFEAWIQEIATLSHTQFSGYLGLEVIRPTCESHYSNEYVSIFRFDTYENLQIFMNSEDRKRMLEKACIFEEGPIELTYHSLEYWFVPPSSVANISSSSTSPVAGGSVVGPPSKEKMAIVTFLLIWLQVHFLGPAYGGISKLPPLAAEALTVFTVVVGTTYLWMPITTQYILRWWLFPNKRQSRTTTTTRTTKSRHPSVQHHAEKDEEHTSLEAGSAARTSSLVTVSNRNKTIEEEDEEESLDV